MPNLFFVILVRQEKIAILILVVVIGVMLISAGILESAGKGIFSRPYGPDCADGELVHHQGVVEQSTLTTTGGHQMLVVSGVRIFIPSSSVQKEWPRVGQSVSLYGTVQTYRGEREILIRSSGDIGPLPAPG
ncbi:MAG: hypothetical protein MUC66_05395 [Methanolinea sp.]|jgi:hypothetical protein|nr:hypothetical protein [Methanolinea sp.]